MLPKDESIILPRGCPMIFVAIGANLSDSEGRAPLVACRAAAEALRSLPGLRLVRLSRWYRSAPVPASDQPDFVNGVAALQGTIDPRVLLGRLQAIEARAGRVRGAANAARTLDLDIIDCNGATRGVASQLAGEGADLVLPHPRAHERAFVLLPLRDVAPAWRHPTLGRSVADLIAALPAQDISRI
jgi:2-amino-4-hydroxy-6-hydroxymethyldihydropteridine diphosphokinase